MLPVTDLGVAAIITAVIGAIVAIYQLWRSREMDAAVEEKNLAEKQAGNIANLTARENFVWEQAKEFWREQADILRKQVEQEREAREAAISRLRQEKQQDKDECAALIADLQGRLKKAAEVLVATVEAASDAATAATESTNAAAVAEGAATAAKEAGEAAVTEINGAANGEPT